MSELNEIMQAQVDVLTQENAELRAEVERLRAAAEEYEWLKRQGWFYDAEAEQYTIEFRAPYCKDLRQAPRAAIDAAKGAI